MSLRTQYRAARELEYYEVMKGGDAAITRVTLLMVLTVLSSMDGGGAALSQRNCLASEYKRYDILLKAK